MKTNETARELAQRRQAQQGLEDLAAKCLQPSLMVVHMEEGGIVAGQGIDWSRAARVSVQMALTIRLECRGNVDRLFATQEGRETVAALADSVASKVPN